MAGNIAAKVYDANNLPSTQEIVEDAYELLDIYDEIECMIGSREIDEFYDYVQSKENFLLLEGKEFDERVEELIKTTKVVKSTAYTPEPKKEPVKDNEGKMRMPRDPKVVVQALKNADYQCEIDFNIKTYTSRNTGKPILECHHIIPMNAHENFKYSLDVPANVCALNPIVHRCIHQGIDSEREQILAELYDARKEQLEQSGIEISFEQLKLLYGIK